MTKQHKGEEKIRDWDNRPKGCTRTISGMHTPIQKIENYQIIFSCSSCGLIDDTSKFRKWMYGNPIKIDD